MNFVEVIGGPAKEREIAEAVARWCIKKLLPRVRTLNIKIKIAKCDAYGYAHYTDDHKTFEIEIKKGMKLYDLISTVCHEMVHAKQYYRKELTHIGPELAWKKKLYSDTKYADQPWEKEAFKLEEELALECFKELDVNLNRTKYD